MQALELTRWSLPQFAQVVGVSARITRTVILVVILTAVHTACRHIKEYKTMTVPLAVVTRFKSRPGFERMNSYSEVKERLDAVNRLVVSYLM